MSQVAKKFIIALTGHKSPAANYLVEKYGFCELSFSDPLTQSLSIILDTPINWFVDPTLKDTIIPHWGKSPQYFMQKWETDAFHEYVNPESNSLWVQRMNKKIQETNNQLIVISDCKSDHELDFINGLDNVYKQIIKIVDVDIEDCRGNADHLIINNSDLFKDIDQIISSTDCSPYYAECNGIPKLVSWTIPIPIVKSTSQIPAVIGKTGEEYVIGVIKGAYPEVQVENISSKSRAGDILFRPHLQSVGYHAQIMFEVKKYNAKVPTAQYEKFLRDIRESNHDAGVFISLTSSITGITDSIVIDTIVTERDGTTVPVIIASTSDKNIIQSLTALIIGYVTLLRKKDSFVQQSDFAVRLIGSLQTSLNAYNGIRSKVHDLRTSNEKMLDSIQESLATNYTEIRVLLNQLQGLIEVEDEPATELELEKVADIECPYEYPKSINQFLLILHEKNTCQSITYVSENKIVCKSTYIITISVLKTKVTCTISGFTSNDHIYKSIEQVCRKSSDVPFSMATVNQMFPFDSYVVTKKTIKFDLTPKVYDIVVNFLN
jgi:hypothetical protein